MNVIMVDAKSKKRDKISIIAEVLYIAKGGTLKTQVMYKANLSFAQLNDYLKLMINADLLKQINENKRDIYLATSKGMDFLKQYNDLFELLNGNVQRSKGSFA